MPLRREYVPTKGDAARAETFGSFVRSSGHILSIAILHRRGLDPIVSLEVRRDDGSRAGRVELRAPEFAALESAIAAARELPATGAAVAKPARNASPNATPKGSP